MWAANSDELRPHFVEDLIDSLQERDEYEQEATSGGGGDTDMVGLAAYVNIVNATMG